MENQAYIEIEIVCQQYCVELPFILSLQHFGLIEIEQRDKQYFIPLSQLAEVEKIMRLQDDLQINTEGVDIALHLLQKIDNLQREIILLKSRLSLYEDIEE